MSWFNKDKDFDYTESAVKYCQSLNDKSRIKLQNKIAQLEKENEELKKVSTDILLDRSPAMGYLPNDPSFSTIVANISVSEYTEEPRPLSHTDSLVHDKFPDCSMWVNIGVMPIYLGQVKVGTMYYNGYDGSKIVWCEPTYLKYLSTSFETVEVLDQYKKYIEDNIDEVSKFVYDNISQLTWRYSNYVGNSANNVQN